MDKHFPPTPGGTKSVVRTEHIALAGGNRLIVPESFDEWVHFFANFLLSSLRALQRSQRIEGGALRKKNQGDVPKTLRAL